MSHALARLQIRVHSSARLFCLHHHLSNKKAAATNAVVGMRLFVLRTASADSINRLFALFVLLLLLKR